MFHRPSSLVRLLCALGWLGLGSPSLPAQAPVRLVAEKAQLASGEVTGLRFCFTTRPLENWKVSVDGEGGGSVEKPASGNFSGVSVRGWSRQNRCEQSLANLSRSVKNPSAGKRLRKVARTEVWS